VKKAAELDPGGIRFVSDAFGVLDERSTKDGTMLLVTKDLDEEWTPMRLKFHAASAHAPILEVKVNIFLETLADGPTDGDVYSLPEDLRPEEEFESLPPP